MPNGTYKFSPEKKAAVIALLGKGCRRYSAMKAVGMTGQMLSYWIGRDPEFAAQVDQAEMLAGAKVEDALFKSALSGNVTAQIFYLCNRKPDEWRHVNTPSLTVNQDNRSINVTVDHRQALVHTVAALAARAGENGGPPSPNGHAS